MFQIFEKEYDQLRAVNAAFEELLTNDSLKNYSPKISIGVRVRIDYEDGETQKGRVLSFNRNKNEWMISRDGYSGTIGIPIEKLTLELSGIEAFIDQKLWHNKIRLEELSTILKGSDLPKYFTNREYVNVKVVAKSESHFNFCFIDCEIHGYQPVQRIKIPSSFAIVDNFLQFHIENQEITDIHFISKEKYLDLE